MASNSNVVNTNVNSNISSKNRTLINCQTFSKFRDARIIRETAPAQFRLSGGPINRIEYFRNIMADPDYEIWGDDLQYIKDNYEQLSPDSPIYVRKSERHIPVFQTMNSNSSCQSINLTSAEPTNDSINATDSTPWHFAMASTLSNQHCHYCGSDYCECIDSIDQQFSENQKDIECEHDVAWCEGTKNCDGFFYHASPSRVLSLLVIPRETLVKYVECLRDIEADIDTFQLEGNSHPTIPNLHMSLPRRLRQYHHFEKCWKDCFKGHRARNVPDQRAQPQQVKVDNGELSSLSIRDLVFFIIYYENSSSVKAPIFLEYNPNFSFGNIQEFKILAFKESDFESDEKCVSVARDHMRSFGNQQFPFCEMCEQFAKKREYPTIYDSDKSLEEQEDAAVYKDYDEFVESELTHKLRGPIPLTLSHDRIMELLKAKHRKIFFKECGALMCPNLICYDCCHDKYRTNEYLCKSCIVKHSRFDVLTSSQDFEPGRPGFQAAFESFCNTRAVSVKQE